MLADLAERAAQSKSRLILLDPMSQRWPPGPAAPLLRLLETDLPWAVTLTRPPHLSPNTHPRPPDLDPVLSQTGRLSEHLLTDELRAATERHTQLRGTHRDAHQRHLTVTALRRRGRDQARTLEQGRGHDASIDNGLADDM